MAKTLVIHPEHCTGCRAWARVCSVGCHGAFNPSRSRIPVNVVLPDVLDIPTVWTRCDQPAREEASRMTNRLMMRRTPLNDYPWSPSQRAFA